MLVLSLLCCLTGAAHAAPASHPAAPHKAYLSLIIDDLGQNLPRDRRVLGLPGPVTTAVMPDTPHAAEFAREAYKAGKLRAIGVSNFFPDRLADICTYAEIKPMVNQVETHPFDQQRKAHEYMDKFGVAHESWGPFAEGRKDMFKNSVIQAVGDRYGKTVAQVILRFLMQSDVIVIPKSTHKERMIQNLDVFDFKLNEEDMKQIQGLDEADSAFFSHYDPEMIEMLSKFNV